MVMQMAKIAIFYEIPVIRLELSHFSIPKKNFKKSLAI